MILTFKINHACFFVRKMAYYTGKLNSGKMLLNDQNTHTVSVVIPAYNLGKHIARAIDSVLAQTHKPDEIIVVDDGSTDDTAGQIKKYGDRVKYLYQQNSGASVARNTGIKAAKSQWIAFLDGDDEWLPEKLQLQIEHLIRNPQLQWTTGNFLRCLCDEKRVSSNIDPQIVKDTLGNKEYFDDFLFYPLPHGCGCMITKLIKKDLLEKAGLFTPGQLRANDLDMWFRIAYISPKIGFIAEPLATYHMIIDDSISQKYQRAETLQGLIKRHMKLSAEHGRQKAFRLNAASMIKSLIRSMLFENQPDKIKELLTDFPDLLTLRFKIIIRLLIITPGLTAKICHTISKVVRALNPRKRVMRRPKS